MHGIYIGYIIDPNLCCTGVWLVFFHFYLRLATPQVERKVKTHSAVGKHCGYMLNTQVMQLCTLNLCGLYYISSAFFLSTWDVILISL